MTSPTHSPSSAPAKNTAFDALDQLRANLAIASVFALFYGFCLVSVPSTHTTGGACICQVNVKSNDSHNEIAERVDGCLLGAKQAGDKRPGSQMSAGR
jgi:hypothetical protein